MARTNNTPQPSKDELMILSQNTPHQDTAQLMYSITMSSVNVHHDSVTP